MILFRTICGRSAWALAVLLVVGVSSSGAGQGTGTISGAIDDESGGVLPGVTVTATNTRTGAERTAISNGQGRYEISNVPAGSYAVRGVLPGFSGDAATVTIGAGGSAMVDMSLAIAPLAETVTVTRTEQQLSAVPTAVAVVGRETIKVGQRRASLDESLRGVPGLLVQNRRSYTVSGGVGLAIRRPQSRFGIRGLALLQDGIPITTADGTTEPGNVDIGSMGRIEVIRGPSSVLYGNAAGGVINITTEFNPERRVTFEPDIQFGSYGYNRQQVKVTGREGNTDYLVNASRFETDGFREQSQAEIRQANVVVRSQISPATEIRGVFNFYDSPFAGAPSFLTEEQARETPRMGRDRAVAQNWNEVTTQGQGGVTIQHQFSGGPRLRATGWGVGRDLEATGVGRIIDLNRKGGGFRTEVLGQDQLGELPLTWTAGFDLSSQSDDRNEARLVANPNLGGDSSRGDGLVDQQEDVLSLGPFVQATLEVLPRWQVNGGVRFDYFDFTADDRKLDDGDQSGNRTMSAASPSVGVTFLAASGLNLYSSLSTAYETPTAQELSNRPTGEGGFNQDLEPEDLTSWEIGVRGLSEPARLRYEFAFYTAQVTNGLVGIERPDGEVFYANAGETSRNGVEMLVEWVPDASFSARFTYTYQDFTFDRFTDEGGDAFDGNIEPGAPPHQIFAGVTHRTPYGLTSIAQVRWVDEYTVRNDNTAFNWAYTVVDLRFALDRRFGDSDVRAFIGIDNLFDERYNAWTIPNGFGGRYYDPSPGREVYGGVTIGFGVR